MILLVDNYDSFTYNLVQYLSEFSLVQVCRNDDPQLFDLAAKATALVLSPGPGKPSEAGKMPALIKAFYQKKPILGICLGHQALAETFGAKIDQALEIKHGKTSDLQLAPLSGPLFKGLPERFTIMRYHSLIVTETSLPMEFNISGRATDDQEIMALAHQRYPLYGLQFHPESIGTEHGLAIIKNFCELVDTLTTN